MAIELHVLCAICISESDISPVDSGNHIVTFTNFGPYNKRKRSQYLAAKICQTRGAEIITQIVSKEGGYILVAKKIENKRDVAYSRREAVKPSCAGVEIGRHLSLRWISP